MALGQRTVADLMVEIGLALLEPPTVQSLASPVSAASPATLVLNASTTATLPASPLLATQYLYPGAQVIVGWQAADAEVATVLTIASDGVTFTANLANNHAAGETVFGATFPTQQPTDPIFTQSEIIGYIAQAQNEFLTKVPLIFQLFPNQLISIGQTYQTLPATAIELERVAVQSGMNSYPIVSVSRSGGTVTATVTLTPTDPQWVAWNALQKANLAAAQAALQVALAAAAAAQAAGNFTLAETYSNEATGYAMAAATASSALASQTPPNFTSGLPVLVAGVTDNTYNSASNATFLLQTVDSTGTILTWAQAGGNSSSSGGVVAIPVMTRLYESSQEQLSMNQPWWSAQQGTPPTQWFEDRSGIYGWGVAPPPAGNFYMELLTSVRASENLTLLSSFLVPDCFVYAIKWRALAYCWSKDGVQRSPTMARFAKGKFDFYCLLADRFLRAVVEKVGGGGGGGNF